MAATLADVATARAVLKPPFPWFGGKRKIAAAVWERLGHDVPNYCEPFAGGLAVLLGRPLAGGGRVPIETVNDVDALIVNFWRAVTADPEAVAAAADWPVGEVDLMARHRWMSTVGAEHVERLKQDPHYYSAQIAGWWVWGQCCWIGAGWCQGNLIGRKRPHLSTAGNGIHTKLPVLSGPGNGIHCGGGASGEDPATSRTEWLKTTFGALRSRLRHVRTVCGDWARVLTPAVSWRNGTTGVLLDPPYGFKERSGAIYRTETDCAPAVREWAIENGQDPRLRIALCGYDSEHQDAMPAGWSMMRWKAHGGFGVQGNGRGRANRERECVWFSPHCLPPGAACLALGR